MKYVKARFTNFQQKSWILTDATKIQNTFLCLLQKLSCPPIIVKPVLTFKFLCTLYLSSPDTSLIQILALIQKEFFFKEHFITFTDHPNDVELLLCFCLDL